MISLNFFQATSRMSGSKNNLRNNLEEHPDTIMRDDSHMIRDESLEPEPERFRDRNMMNGSATTAREEERRKVLEIEEERIR